MCIRDRLQTAIEMTRFAEPYTYRRAMRHLEKGRVVLFACGTGNPFFSTDTAAALRAVEIGADAILLAKNIDGVYDDDPRQNPEAKLLKDITYAEAQQRGLRVMDAAAITICMENKVPAIRVFGLDDPENILRVMQGDSKMCIRDSAESGHFDGRRTYELGSGEGRIKRRADEGGRL